MQKLFHAFSDNASELDLQTIYDELGWLLIPEEKFEKGYILLRDILVFTNKRLIFVDKQGLSGKKLEITSIPYKNIIYFSVETAGIFDLDSELQILVIGNNLFTKEFRRNVDIYAIYKLLSSYTLAN